MPAAKRGRPDGKAAAKPLDGYCIAFSGRFPGYSQKDLQNIASRAGATVTTTVGPRTTHLVCEQKDLDKASSKVAQAKRLLLPLVKLNWIVQGAASQATLPPDNFLWQFDEDDSPRTKKATSSVSDEQNEEISTLHKTTELKEEQDEDGEPAKKRIKPVATGQFLKNKALSIPIDERCPFVHVGGYQVYVDPSGMIYDASLNLSSTSNNHNKYYRIQILTDSSRYLTWTRWGRVGEPGQHAMLGDETLHDAIKHFEKKFRDKSGLKWQDRGNDPKPGKYAFVERSYESDSEEEGEEDDTKSVKKEEEEEEYADSTPPECTLSKPVQDLMEIIFNQNFFEATMTSLNYDADKLPLGKLSKATILRGFQQLKDMAALLDDPALASSKWNMTVAGATEHLSNMYYSVIPHAFGRNRPPIIGDDARLKKEIELLESLLDMKDAADIMKIDRKRAESIHMLDNHYQSLNMNEMSPLGRNTDEYRLLQKYLVDSRGSTHVANFTVHSIFRIERAGEHERFNGSKFTRIPSDKRLLWHGSRCTNFGGILSQGLRIAPPEAPVSGYMFGKGIYLADMSSKSANYCCSYYSNGHALLLLCEAELGDPMQTLVDASYSAGEDAEAKNMFSTWGMGSTGPSKWMDARAVHDSLRGVQMPDTNTLPGPTNVPGAGLMYNEYICYDIAQVKLRYLFHVQM